MLVKNDVILSDAAALSAQFEAESVSLIIADPPYGIGYHSNYYKNKNPHSPVTHDWNFQIDQFIRECARILADKGALYLFSRWDVYPLWWPCIEASGLKIKTVIVWVKNNWSAGDLKGCFGNQHEEILFVVKGRHKLRGKRYPNVWNFDRIPAKSMLVPTQKPVALLKRAIEASSDQYDLVFDPFCGSGSVGEAAMLLNRKFFLGDIDLNMVNIARKRLGFTKVTSLQAEKKKPTFEPQMEFPRSEQWGMHPEDIRFIYDELKGNIGSNLK